MKTTTYTAGKDLILHDGEIFLFSHEPHTPAKASFYYRRETYNILATTDKSTAQLDGVIKLDRQQFVKPVDLANLSVEYCQQADCGNTRESRNCIADFQSGYNANKGVYTREQLIEAMKYASSHLSSVNGIYKYIDSLQDLSLPKSLTINDNNEIIEISWN